MDREASGKQRESDDKVELVVKGSDTDINRSEACQRASRRTEDRQETTNEGIKRAIDTVYSVPSDTRNMASR